MKTKEVAEKFVEYYRSDNPLKKYELYNKDCESTERFLDGKNSTTKGIENIKEKGVNFYEQFQIIHKKEVGDPLITKNNFVVSFVFDVTMKATEKRVLLEELAVYWVLDGEIVRQEFIHVA